MPTAIEPFIDEYLDGAATLLAARHRADRTQQPRLPRDAEDIAVARAAVQAAREPTTPELWDTSGVVALRGGRVAGYLLGSIALPPPTSGLALFLRPRSVRIVTAGHAVDTDGGPDLYRELYAAAAPRWLAAGCFSHYIEVPAADRHALETWFSLGFGQEMARGLRDTGPVPALSVPAGTQIHLAGAEDIEVVMRLARANLRHHAGPPIFSPYFAETAPAMRKQQQELLADPANAHWLAYRDGEAVGMQTYVPPRPGLTTPERSIHLQHGYTAAFARGGVGAALLQHAMAWAHDAGHAHCTVNWMTANLLGARFWQRNGFRPLTQRLVRRLDERIAWAQGRE